MKRPHEPTSSPAASPRKPAPKRSRQVEESSDFAPSESDGDGSGLELDGAVSDEMDLEDTSLIESSGQESGGEPGSDGEMEELTGDLGKMKVDESQSEAQSDDDALGFEASHSSPQHGRDVGSSVGAKIKDTVKRDFNSSEPQLEDDAAAEEAVWITAITVKIGPNTRIKVPGTDHGEKAKNCEVGDIVGSIGLDSRPAWTKVEEIKTLRDQTRLKVETNGPIGAGTLEVKPTLVTSPSQKMPVQATSQASARRQLKRRTTEGVRWWTRCTSAVRGWVVRSSEIEDCEASETAVKLMRDKGSAGFTQASAVCADADCPGYRPIVINSTEFDESDVPELVSILADPERRSEIDPYAISPGDQITLPAGAFLADDTAESTSMCARSRKYAIGKSARPLALIRAPIIVPSDAADMDADPPHGYAHDVLNAVFPFGIGVAGVTMFAWLMILAWFGGWLGDGLTGTPSITASDEEWGVMVRVICGFFPTMPANPSRSAHHLALYRYSFIAAERPGVAIVGRASWSANLITRFLRKLLGAASDKNALPLRFLKSVGRLGFLFLLAGFICADGHWNPRKRAYILRQCACHGPLIRVLHGACLFYELRPSPISDILGEGRLSYEFSIPDPSIVAELQAVICRIGWGQTRKVGGDDRPRHNRTILNVSAAQLVENGDLIEIRLANGGSLITSDGIVVGAA